MYADANVTQSPKGQRSDPRRIGLLRTAASLAVAASLVALGSSRPTSATEQADAPGPLRAFAQADAPGPAVGFAQVDAPGPAVGFADWRFPTLRQFRLYRSTTDGWISDDRTVGNRLLRAAVLKGSRVDGSDLTFAVADHPDLGTMQYCTGSQSCHDIRVGVRPATGRMFLFTNETRDNLPLPLHVADYPDQRVELSVADSDSSLRVHQEVLIDFPSRGSDCDDFPDMDANRFACMFLDELHPNEAPATTQALRDDLPALVQSSGNYSLIFAEEFNGSPESGECQNGMVSLDPAIWDYDANPCNNRDLSNRLCANVKDGYYFMAISSHSGCNAWLENHGKFSYKYGYLEVKYRVYLGSDSAYTNFAFSLGDTKVPLSAAFKHYDDINSLDNYEKLTRTIGTVINVFEYLPAYRRIVTHEWVNHKPFIDVGDTQPRRTNRSYYLRSWGGGPTHILFCPAAGCYTDSWITVTQGLEWTPRGYRAHIKVDGVHDDFIVIPKDKIEVQDVHPYNTLSNDDPFFEYLDFEDTDSLLSQVAISHVPLDLAISNWGYPNARTFSSTMRVDYIRVFQPDNLYLDMEPVYQ